MEQILIYLSIAFIVVLIIVLGVTFHKLNKVRTNYKIVYSGALRNKELIDSANKGLSEYKKINVLQINKINELEDEVKKYGKKLFDYEMKNVALQDELEDKVVFINALNERLQKAEAERDKLQSKLSRKGLGKKGRKKKEQHIGGGEYFANNPDNTISIGIDLAKENSDFSHITEVEFEEQKYVDITSTEQLKQYVGYKFECVLTYEGCYITCSGKLISNGKVFILAFNGSNGWELSKLEKELADNLYNKGWVVFDDDFGDTIKSLKILL